MAAQYYDMMAAGHLKYEQCKESIAKQILMSKQGTWYDSMSDKNLFHYLLHLIFLLPVTILVVLLVILIFLKL